MWRDAAVEVLGDLLPPRKEFTAAYLESMNKTDREQMRIGFDAYPKFSLPTDETEREQAVSIVWIIALSNMLRNLWTEPDLRQKEGRAFLFRSLFYSAGSDADTSESMSADELLAELLGRARFPHIPPPIPFEQALSYLVKYANKARYCANPECPAPYFFVQRKNQRYCSEICAAPAQRELKRRWWAEHGEEWRAARQGKKPSKSRAGKGKSVSRQKQTSKKAQKGSK